MTRPGQDRSANAPIEAMRALSRPLAPMTSGVTARPKPIGGIRAILFDVYGTLFVSASGDIGTLGAAAGGKALVEALRAAGFGGDLESAGRVGEKLLLDRIRALHAQRRREGVEHPEVELVTLWQDTLRDLSARGLLAADATRAAAERVAVEYECRVNPVWPMPGLQQVLKALRQRGVILGLVSNAQFYTPLLFDALLGQSADELGFDPALCVWSYELGEAKPSARLVQQALAVLGERGVEPAAVLCVGNDMLNDILPAAQCGCRTALFAGDARSLRRREGDERCAGLQPDAVVTDLRELLEVVR